MPDEPGSKKSSQDKVKKTFFKKMLNFLKMKKRKSAKGARLKEALHELIEEAEDVDGEVGADEAAIFGNMIRLRDVRVNEIVIPRTEIKAVDVEMKFDQLVKVFLEEAHSRMPVYRHDLDHIVGMIHVKDVFAHVVDKVKPPLKDLTREVIFASPAMRALDLLLEMQEKRVHLAIVVDEHGGTDGLLTIEDVVEQVVGKIEDEHDIENGPMIVERADGVILADARSPIEEFEKRVGIILSAKERENIETLGGLAFNLAGRVPARGEVLTHPSGFEFEVVDGDSRRVQRLRIRRK